MRNGLAQPLIAESTPDTAAGSNLLHDMKYKGYIKAKGARGRVTGRRRDQNTTTTWTIPTRRRRTAELANTRTPCNCGAACRCSTRA